MLEELGVPFSVKTVDIRKGEQKAPAYLKLNPAGKVPTLTDGAGGSEREPGHRDLPGRPLWLRHAGARMDEADRGPYLKWMVFSTAVVDPVATLHEQKIDLPGFGASFGAFDEWSRWSRAYSRTGSICWASGSAPPTWCWAARCHGCSTRRSCPRTRCSATTTAGSTAREAFQRAADATWPAGLLPAPA